MIMINQVNWKKGNDLIPAIIQDYKTNQVLMLGYMNQEALQKTLETGKVTFWSRRKHRLWMKGESSGNYLKLIEIALDCDQDTILVIAKPYGPVCHLGTKTCFGSRLQQKPSPVFLYTLEKILSERKNADPKLSYTAHLCTKGTKRIAQKVGEEGLEVALAAVTGDQTELVNESADLFYHLLLLLQTQGLSLADIITELEKRHEKV